jgi:hypothetical protein
MLTNDIDCWAKRTEYEEELPTSPVSDVDQVEAAIAKMSQPPTTREVDALRKTLGSCSDI